MEKKSKKQKKYFKINKIKENNKIENIPKIIKVRNPGVDLIRLISMYGTIINHILYHGNGINKFYRYKKQLKILHIILFWHNDGFALISGIVGYKTNKYSNLLYLWFYVLFYSIVIHFYFIKFRPNSIIKDPFYVEFLPMVFQRYWYFTAYFGMYLFLPIINKGISILTKSELKLVVMSTLGIFVIWRGIKRPDNDVFQIKEGNSVIWLLIFYLTGAYIGKFRVNYIGIKKYIYCIIILFIYSFSTILYYKSFNKELGKNKGHYIRKIIKLLEPMINEYNDAPIKIIQSISITLFLLQIKYNKYLTKIISFFGPLAFSIFLIHNNKLVIKNIILKIFMKDPDNLNLNSTIILVLVKAFKIFFFCLFIDYLRHLIFTFLRIRKICIFFEKIVFKLFDKFN